VILRKLEEVFRGVGWVVSRASALIRKGSATSGGRAVGFDNGARSEKTMRCSSARSVSSVWFPRCGGSRRGGGPGEGADGELAGHGG
jgi:hypothetical protein